MHVGSFQKNSHNSRGIRLWDFVLWSVCFTWLLNYSFNLVCCCFASCQLCVYFRVLSLQSGPCTFLLLVFSQLVFHCFIVLVSLCPECHSFHYICRLHFWLWTLLSSFSVLFCSFFCLLPLISFMCSCFLVSVIVTSCFTLVAICPCVLHLAFLPLL